NSGDRFFELEDGIDARRKAHLNGSLELATIVVASRHHSPKQADVKKVLAHPGPSPALLFVIGLLGRKCECRVGSPMAAIESDPLLNVHLVTGVRSRRIVRRAVRRSRRADVVANLALDGHVRDQTPHVERVNTWLVSGIRIAVRIAVCDVKQQYRVMAAGGV